MVMLAVLAALIWFCASLVWYCFPVCVFDIVRCCYGHGVACGAYCSDLVQHRVCDVFLCRQTLCVS